MYAEGIYFQDPTRHSEDAEYKANALKKVLLNFLINNNIQLTSYADVGCGSGEVSKILAKELKSKFKSLKTINGFDISPHVEKLLAEDVEFVKQDFTKVNTNFDLVTLNDVFEHVTNPIAFLSKIRKRAKFVVMHIPLEDCLLVNLRNLQKRKIKNPGHLLFLNINSALNLITSSGLKILDYEFSIDSIKAPSNKKTLVQKIGYPIKIIIAKTNPYLYSKIFGISLIVVAKGIE